MLIFEIQIWNRIYFTIVGKLILVHHVPLISHGCKPKDSIFWQADLKTDKAQQISITCNVCRSTYKYAVLLEKGA